MSLDIPQVRFERLRGIGRLAFRQLRFLLGWASFPEFSEVRLCLVKTLALILEFLRCSSRRVTVALAYSGSLSSYEDKIRSACGRLGIDQSRRFWVILILSPATTHTV